MAHAYACLVFDTRARHVIGWDIFSAPADQLTSHGHQLFAQVASADGASYDEAIAKVTAIMLKLAPTLPPGTPLECTTSAAARIAGDRVRELEAELQNQAAALHRAREHIAKLRAEHEPTPPAEPAEVYSCAVCSMKTDEPPVASLHHQCCDRVAHIGPCCARATTNHPDDVLSLMEGANHARGCPGRP